MRKILLLLFIVAVTATSCRRNIEACVQVSNTTPALGQEITVVNCTKNYDYYEIDMGDGKLYDDNNGILNHAYEKSGTYRITLSAEDDRGRDSDETSEIVVVAPPNAAQFEGFWEYYKVETVTIYDLEAGPGYGDITIESSTLVDSTLYYMDADTIQVFDVQPDTMISIYGSDWILGWDSNPDLLNLDLLGFYFVAQLYADELVLRQRENNRHRYHYFRKSQM